MLRRLGRLWRDRRGAALLEFGFTLPIVLMMGLYGFEYANLALVNMKVNQIALNLADNASRVGVNDPLSMQQLREVDMNDVLQAARMQGAGIRLSTYGRIVVSSLENVKQKYDSAPVQRIHWQRCLGMKGGAGYDSSQGTTTTTAGTDATAGNAGTTAAAGLGDPGAKVNAPAGSGAMFVEVNYLYQPIVGAWVMTPPKIRFVASFIVRDRRDFAQIFNPSPGATRMTCDKYTA